MNTYMSSHRASAKGLTLIELLVVTAIVAILVSLAGPALGPFLARWQRDSATKAITAHLQLARSTAIKTSRRVVMCISLDGLHCATSAYCDWAVGWVVYQDDNSNNAFDSTESLVAASGPLAGILSLASSNKIRRFVFMPNGLMAAGMGSLVVTPANENPMKIIVNRVGRFRLSAAR